MPNTLLRRVIGYAGKVWLIVCGLLILCNTAQSLAYSSELFNRSVTIGNSEPNAVTTHTFRFNLRTSSTLGSILFEYCTDPFIGNVCTAPPGLSLSAATLTGQTGVAGFSMDSSSTANKIILSRSPAGATGGTAVSYTFSNVTNPSTVNQSYYVRIGTYASNDASGPVTDFSSVVFDLNTGVNIGGFVPPFLTLCVGAVVAIDCSNQTGDISDLGNLSTTSTKHATTEFSVATNDVNGYNAYVIGTTLTSGNNIINAPSAPQTSQIGTSQFGMNLVANTAPLVGSSPLGTGTGTVAAGYNQPNNYKFQSGDLVAHSSLSTDFNLFTVSYIVNINKSQPAGVYTTTLTYTAIVDF
jgi:hypothetical protein